MWRAREWVCIAGFLVAGCGGDDSTKGNAGQNSGLPAVGADVDIDGDGAPDGKAVDTNGDGIADGVDTNGDGVPEVLFTPPAGDGDGDGDDVSGDGDNSSGDGDDVSGDGDGALCEDVVVPARPLAPDMLIVLDRSGSMIGFGSDVGVNRWNPSVAALKTVTEELEATIHFGLMTFPKPGGFLSCDVGQVNVPIAGGNAGKIASALDGLGPDTGQTPTGPVLQEALKVLNPQALAPDEVQAPKYVLLVTDGEPTCTGDPVGDANKAIEQLAAAGVKTYVVGFDLSAATDTMNGFAQRGGTEKFIPVENQDSLSKALKEIAGKIAPCEYQLEKEPADPDYVLVEIDGKQINLAKLDGWQLDGTTVKLGGAACKAVQDGLDHNVSIQVKCEIVEPI